MEQIEYSCYNSTSNWLTAHLVETMFLLVWFSIIILFTCPDRLLAFVCPYKNYEHFNQGSAYTRVRRFFLFIIFEVTLMFTYIFCALVLRWIFNFGPITPMVLNCLIIEAFYGPIIIETLVYFICKYGIIEEWDFINESYHVQFACLIKLVLFLVKRYPEFHATSEFHNLQIRAFYRGCNSTTGHSTSNFESSAFPFSHF